MYIERYTYMSIVLQAAVHLAIINTYTGAKHNYRYGKWGNSPTPYCIQRDAGHSTEGLCLLLLEYQALAPGIIRYNSPSSHCLFNSHHLLLASASRQWGLAFLLSLLSTMSGLWLCVPLKLITFWHCKGIAPLGEPLQPQIQLQVPGYYLVSPDHISLPSPTA